MQRIFVSHSSKDKPLVEAFVNVILDNGCQISRGDIYCSSLEDMKTEPGTPNWIADIKLHMQEAKLIILLLSKNYYASEYCLAELGATWVLGDTIRIFPLIVSPLDVGSVKGIAQITQAGLISNEAHLDKLRDIVVETCEIPNKNTPNWNRQRVRFTDELENLESQLLPVNTVSQEDFKRLQERADVYKQEMDELNTEVARLKTYISRLEQLKDKEEVAKVKIENLPENERFDELIGYVIENLQEIPRIVARSMYENEMGEHISIEDSIEREEAESAVKAGYLKGNWQNGFYMRWDLREMKDVQASISELRSFLRDSSQEFKDAFYETHDYEPVLDIESFWKTYIYPHIRLNW